MTAKLPGSGSRDFAIHGLTPGTVYLVRSGMDTPNEATVGADGVLRFRAPIGQGVPVEARRLGLGR